MTRITGFFPPKNNNVSMESIDRIQARVKERLKLRGYVFNVDYEIIEYIATFYLDEFLIERGLIIPDVEEEHREIEESRREVDRIIKEYQQEQQIEEQGKNELD